MLLNMLYFLFSLALTTILVLLNEYAIEKSLCSTSIEHITWTVLYVMLFVFVLCSVVLNIYLFIQIW